MPEQPLRHPLAALTPVGQSGSPVHDQRAELADAFNAVEAEGDEDYDETAELYQGEPPELSVADVVSIPARKPLVVTAPTVTAPTVIVTPRRESKPRAAAGSKAKAAFTLRLDKERHLKLRLACAVTGRSAQQLVTDALDGLLATMPELDGMAERAPSASKQARN